ncbi:hypothetical protein ABEV54_20040 [Peribacillus psychrosaccharolyticus]|uniref:hypothetical protein n=1 Tax=Peribacillus psychrosaccharolyticus TaxID=1407 RepID=UPI003D2B7154
MEKASFVIGGNRVETFSSLRNNKWLVIAKHGNLYSFNLSRNKDRAKIVGLSRLLMDYEEYELLV